MKIKQVKPVLHYCLRGDMVDVLEYSMKGTKVLASTDNVEQYLRDQVDINSLYEYENKLIIDEEIKDKFTKEGAKRFKAYFAPARVLAKKLSATFSFSSDGTLGNANINKGCLTFTLSFLLLIFDKLKYVQCVHQFTSF